MVSSRKHHRSVLRYRPDRGRDHVVGADPTQGMAGRVREPRRWRLGAGPLEGSGPAFFAFSAPPRPARGHGRHVPGYLQRIPESGHEENAQQRLRGCAGRCSPGETPLALVGEFTAKPGKGGEPESDKLFSRGGRDPPTRAPSNGRTVSSHRIERVQRAGGVPEAEALQPRCARSGKVKGYGLRRR